MLDLRQYGQRATDCLYIDGQQLHLLRAVEAEQRAHKLQYTAGYRDVY